VTGVQTCALPIFASLIRDQFGLTVTIPEYLEEIQLKTGRQFEEFKVPAAATIGVNLPPLFADLKTKLDDVSGKMGKLQTLSAIQQAEIAELLKQAALNIDRIEKRS
jgi:metallo-beta-lactamase family protein